MVGDHHHSITQVGKDMGGHLAQALAQAEPPRAAAQECPDGFDISKDGDSTIFLSTCASVRSPGGKSGS